MFAVDPNCNDLDVTDNSNVGRFPEGMTFANVNNSARALEGILARFYKDVDGSLTTAGSSNAYTLATNQTSLLTTPACGCGRRPRSAIPARRR